MFDTTFGRNLSSSAVQAETDREPSVEGKFNSLKVVIERETKKFSYYWNDRLVATNVGSIHGAECTTFGHIRFQLPYEAMTATTTDSRFYVDNIRVSYADESPAGTPSPTQVPSATAAPTTVPAEPTATAAPAVPTATAAPAQSDDIINVTFDDAELGKYLTQLSGTNWTGGCNESNYPAYSRVVSKGSVFANEGVNDYCMEFEPLTSKTRALDLNFSIVLDEAVRPALGEEGVTENNYAVVEMEVAITGNDTKEKGFKINLNDGIKTVNYSIARFIMFEDSFGRYTSSAVFQDEADQQSSSEGVFHTLKVYIDRETKQFTYYWDGEMAGFAASPIHASNCSTLGHIRFQLPYETSTETTTDSRLYVDNVKVYYQDFLPAPAQPTAAPTAEPTPAPTAGHLFPADMRIMQRL